MWLRRVQRQCRGDAIVCHFGFEHSKLRRLFLLTQAQKLFERFLPLSCLPITSRELRTSLVFTEDDSRCYSMNRKVTLSDPGDSPALSQRRAYPRPPTRKWASRLSWHETIKLVKIETIQTSLLGKRQGCEPHIRFSPSWRFYFK
jgi:hypothetical protein